MPVTRVPEGWGVVGNRSDERTKQKENMKLKNDFTVQVQVFQDGALKSATKTVELIDAWKLAHGYE